MENSLFWALSSTDPGFLEDCQSSKGGKSYWGIKKKKGEKGIFLKGCVLGTGYCIFYEVLFTYCCACLNPILETSRPGFCLLK